MENNYLNIKSFKKYSLKNIYICIYNAAINDNRTIEVWILAAIITVNRLIIERNIYGCGTPGGGGEGREGEKRKVKQLVLSIFIWRHILNCWWQQQQQKKNWIMFLSIWRLIKGKKKIFLFFLFFFLSKFSNLFKVFSI